MRRIVHPLRSGRWAAARACLAVCLAVAAAPLGVSAPAPPVSVADESRDLDDAFQEVKGRAAQVQKELPRLDQVLETSARELKATPGASADPKTLAQVEEARAVVRSHAEDLARFSLYSGMVAHWRDAGQEIDVLAGLLNAEGDRVLRVIAERPARADAGPDALAAPHTAYRKAMTELVDAARRMRDQLRALHERERLAGDGRGGRNDPWFRKLLAQFGEGFAHAAVYVPSTPPELFRPRERPADAALDVALIWDEPAGEWHRMLGSVPVESMFRDAYIALGQRPTAEQLKTLATKSPQINLRRINADEFARFLAGAAEDVALEKAVARADDDGSTHEARREPWLFRIKYGYDDQFHERMLRFLGRLREALAADERTTGPALRRLDEIAGRYNLTLVWQPAESILPAVGAIRVTSWRSSNRKRQSVSIWRFDQDQVTIEIDDRKVLGRRKGNVVMSQAPIPRRNCTMRDTRTFAKSGTLVFTAVQTCTRREGRTRTRDLSGAGTWELLPQPGKATDQEGDPLFRERPSRDPS